MFAAVSDVQLLLLVWLAPDLIEGDRNRGVLLLVCMSEG
jgi:hypothetical protein